MDKKELYRDKDFTVDLSSDSVAIPADRLVRSENVSESAVMLAEFDKEILDEVSRRFGFNNSTFIRFAIRFTYMMNDFDSDLLENAIDTFGGDL